MSSEQMTPEILQHILDRLTDIRAPLQDHDMRLRAIEDDLIELTGRPEREEVDIDCRALWFW